MANANAPFGARPVGSIIGAPLNGMMNTYSAPAAYATDLFIGDPVVVTGARNLGLQTVALATAGATNQLTGFIIGFQPTYSLVTNGYGIASSDRYPIVCDDPSAVFEMMEDSVGGFVAAASIGLNCDLVAGSGNTYSKRSGWMIDSSTVAADATKQILLRDFAGEVDNEEAANYARILFTINLHTKRLGAVAGI